jgi:hypothetical protein
MRRLTGEEAEWATAQFGDAELGDSRRTARLVNMATRVAQRPAGKVSEVFRNRAEREGAYDLLEGNHVQPEMLLRSLASQAFRRAASEPFLFVSVDGSSVALTDRNAAKGFGSVGALGRGGRGLKVISALSLSPAGVPVGLCAQTWWARTNAKSLSAKDKKKRNRKRKDEDKETRYWLSTIDDSCAHALGAGAKLWFLLDREADSRAVLLKLHSAGHRYTVRASWNRLIKAQGQDKQYLRKWLDAQPAGGTYALDVPAGPHRKARLAHMVVRWGRVTLRLRDKRGRREQPLELSVVWAREQGTTANNEKPLDWVLLTHVQVETFDQARHIIYGYTLRWRVEEFHKTWKTGACQVERTQLRTQRAVTLWATILAAVAVRVERLKRLARTTPELSADVELSEHEIKALIVLRRDIKSRNEVIADTTPTVGQATLWLAELGGYTGKSSGGPPGSITIRRGLDYLRPAAKLLQILQDGQELASAGNNEAAVRGRGS